jgi:hypothetical protein
MVVQVQDRQLNAIQSDSQVRMSQVWMMVVQVQHDTMNSMLLHDQQTIHACNHVVVLSDDQVGLLVGLLVDFPEFFVHRNYPPISSNAAI